MIETGMISGSGTQPERTGDAKQVPTARLGFTDVSTVSAVPLNSHPVASDVAPVASSSALQGHLVRVTRGQTTISLSLDTKLLSEQDRIRKLNESIRRQRGGS